MIRLENLSKLYHTPMGVKVVAKDVNMTFPTRASVALLGRNGAGKTTMLQIIAGTTNPTSGRVVSDGSISWPVGYAGSFNGDLTGAQNVKFLSRVYGVDTQALTDFVEDFAELGSQFYMPFRTYSSGMRSRLAFGVSMGIHFDTYLVDEITAVGDRRFRSKSEAYFQDRMARSGAIFVAHSMSSVRRMCQHGVVLEKGAMTWHDDVNDAIAHHEENLLKA